MPSVARLQKAVSRRRCQRPSASPHSSAFEKSPSTCCRALAPAQSRGWKRALAPSLGSAHPSFPTSNWSSSRKPDRASSHVCESISFTWWQGHMTPSHRGVACLRGRRSACIGATSPLASTCSARATQPHYRRPPCDETSSLMSRHGSRLLSVRSRAQRLVFL